MTKRAVSISALCLGALGALLLFAPREAMGVLTPLAGADGLVQLGARAPHIVFRKGKSSVVGTHL
jgi:hypothetical protein